MENKVKSKILIFGASGYIGKEDLNDHEKIVDLLRQVDVVISLLPVPLFLEQVNIIDAIKAAGNIKEFGIEVDKVKNTLPAFEKKRKIRRVIEEAAIPCTYVCANAYAAYFVNYLLHPHQHHTESDDKIVVYGTGTAKVVMNYEEDIAMYTIKAADDPRTLNRVLIVRLEKNIISQLQLIHLWEKKIGRTFNKLHIPHKELVELSKVLPHPENVKMAIVESIFAKGDTMSYELEKNDVEASKLYPGYEYTSIDQLLDIFLVDPPSPASAAL